MGSISTFFALFCSAGRASPPYLVETVCLAWAGWS